MRSFNSSCSASRHRPLFSSRHRGTVTLNDTGASLSDRWPPLIGPGDCYENGSIVARDHQAWEKFRLIDQGNCTYAIQTTSGFFAGIFKDGSGVMLLTTRRDGAATANEKFQLVVFGLASPPIIQ